MLRIVSHMCFIVVVSHLLQAVTLPQHIVWNRISPNEYIAIIKYKYSILDDEEKKTCMISLSWIWHFDKSRIFDFEVQNVPKLNYEDPRECEEETIFFHKTHWIRPIFRIYR